MKKMTSVTILVLMIAATGWAQLTVKNSGGNIVMQVDDQARVTIGTTTTPGDLTTHTLTILDGAADGRVLKSDASGLASWGTDQVDDADADPTNEYQDLVLDGNILEITDGNRVPLPTGSDNQELTRRGYNLDIERGNSVTLPDGRPLGGSQITIGSDGRTVNHGNTSSQGNVNNSGRRVIQDISVDGNGHVTGINSATLGDATEDNQPLSEVLTDGNNAGGRNATNFGRIAVGTSSLDSRVRVDGHVTSTLPIFGDYNTSVYATDFNSSDNEKQVVIEGIGTALAADNDKAHLGVQGMLVGGTSNDVWIASASLGYHNTNFGNTVAGVSANVLEVDGYVPSTDLRTAVFIGDNRNTGSNHYGLYVVAEKHYLQGHLLVAGKMGINIGDREPATWFEISGQPYINANNAGIIMKSSDGQCWQVRVSNSGNLFTTAVTCP